MFFNASGDTLALVTRAEDASPYQLEWWSVATRALRSRVILAESEGGKILSVSQDRRHLTGCVSHPKEIALWDTRSGQLERRFAATDNHVWGVELSPDGRRVAVLIPDKRIDLMDAGTGRLIASIPVRSWKGSAISFTPDSDTLVTGGADNLIGLWDAQTGALRSTLSGHGGEIGSLSVSPDGRTLASHAGDGTLKLWSLATSRELATLAREGGPRAVLFSPDGRLLCAPLWAQKVLVWRAPLETTNTPAATGLTNQAPAKLR